MGVLQSTCCPSAVDSPVVEVPAVSFDEASVSPPSLAQKEQDALKTKAVAFADEEDEGEPMTSFSSLKQVGFFVDDAGALNEERGGVEATPESPKEESLRDKRKLVRNQTFMFVNQDNGDVDTWKPADSMAVVATASNRISAFQTKRSTSSGDGADWETDENEEKRRMLEQVAKLVDFHYDILPAEMIFAEMEVLMGKIKFAREVQRSPLFERFARKLDYFYDVGDSCSENMSDWMEVYNGKGGTQVITGAIDQDDATVLHYNVRVEIPVGITKVMAVANEVELMPKWNALVTGEPQVIGRRTAHYMVLNYQMSAMMGTYKVEVLNEIRRFSDTGGGFLVEYVTSVAPDHPSYKEPKPGFKRMQSVLKNVFVACGSNCTVLIQRGRLKLPFNTTKWVAKTLGGLAGKFVIGGLVSNAMMACQDGNPWEDLMEEDKFGLYQRLDELVESKESQDRDPTTTPDGKVAEYSVENFFNTRRFKTEESRHPVLSRMPTGQSLASSATPCYPSQGSK